MRLPFFIARRYFFSRKNPSAINIITAIGILGYAVGSCALVVLLSALNGFEKIIFSVYDTYYPDIKIIPATGKVFSIDSATTARIVSTGGIDAVSYVIEESAVLQQGENQVVGLVKGVDDNYTKVIKADSILRSGNLELNDNPDLAWLAEGLYSKVNLGMDKNSLHVMAPRRENVGVSSMDMMEMDFEVSALISPGEEMNQKLMVVSLKNAQEIFEREGSASALEVKLKTAGDESSVRSNLERILGNNFLIRNRQQQNQAVYKMFNTEKWAAFGIMAFVLLIISFNLVGSLSMLVIEKKRDIKILDTMGMRPLRIRRIFFSEGVLVSFFGSGLGILFGVLLVLGQLKYAWIKTQATFAAAYPMELRLSDILLVLALCFVLGVTGAIYPAIKSSPKR